MALESVSAAETVIQSNDDNDLEDGEIPSDEDDEPMQVSEPVKSDPEPPIIPPPVKTESPKHKSFDNKFGKNKKAGSTEKTTKQKGTTSDDWAGDVEKAIRAALDGDKSKNHENKSRSKSNKKNRKRNREEKEDERARDQKKKKLSDEENANEDDDEMLFVRGASPSRKGSHDNSSPRRGDQDNYHSGSDYDDRPMSNRHRDDIKRGGARWAKLHREQRQQDRNNKVSLAANRRCGAKNERGGKNKNRAQLRNDRNGRRQGNDHNQDPDAICVYYMQGKCHRGDDCPFSHNALPPRKMELCKFYLMDCCAKRDKCLYMHHDFPCKFFHTGLKCQAGENCKFSHQPMSEQVKNILLKHLETAPKEILGNFPRLSREGAMYLISNTEKNLAHGQESNQKIPSLFELKVHTPNDNTFNDSGKDDDDHSYRDRHGSSHKDRKSTSGKKSRWGPDEDRVPYDMVVQSATQLGLLANSKQQDKPAANFYNEGGPNDAKKDKNKDKEMEKEKDDSKKAKDTPVTSLINKDIDLRQLITGGAKKAKDISLAEEVATLTKSKLEEESDRDEETDLVIEMPTDDEEKDKHANKAKGVNDTVVSTAVERSKDSPISTSQEIPSNLPKKTQELYMRIQQQQREAQDSFKNLENTEDHEVNQDDWYSDEDNDDDDDDDQLTIVLKDIQKDEEDEEEKKKEPEEDPIPQPASIPQPAAIVDKLGDLSKIDISMEVSKLLSSIKAQSSSSSKQEKEAAKVKKEIGLPSSNADLIKPSVPEVPSPYVMADTGSNSPRLSPGRSPIATVPSQSAPVSRDPRMSRDPRQRRDEQRTSSLGSTGSDGSAPKITDTTKDSRSLRLETSIYSSGIIAQDTTMDTDLRAKLDQDHRRKDMDLRCFPPTSNFGDTDLRMVGGQYPDSSKSGDVDLRQMLSLPFKPVPSHVPCTEIDASISSHPPIPYKVYVVDVPRPDYTGLKLTRNDPQVKYDPRLRKIFRLGKDDLADSPMSPPPVKMLDTPKSPPLVRTDPRRKALEAAAQPPKIIPTTLQHPVQEHPNMSAMSMGITTPYMQGVNNMPVDARGMQGLGPMGPVRGMGPSQVMDPSQGMGPPMLMSGRSMMDGMGSMMREGPVMSVDRGGPMGIDRGGPMGVDRVGPMGVDRGGPMGVDRGGPMGVDRGGPMGVDRGGAMGVDRGGPMGMDRGGPMVIDRGGPMNIDRGGPMGADRGGPMVPPGMRMGGMGNMRMDGPGPNHPGQNQMDPYDPRYNARGSVGVGLLGAGPQGMGGYNQDVRDVRGTPYDGPPARGYPGDNYNNYGDGPRRDRRDPRDYNPNGQDFIDEPNFGGNQGDWNGSQGRMNRKDRRRTTRGKFGGLSRKKDPAS